MSRRHDRERLDAAVDRVLAGLPADADDRLGPAVEAARVTRRALATEVPAGAATQHLTAMFEAARESAGRADPVLVPRPRRFALDERRQRSLGIVMASFVTVLLVSASMVAASTSAIPGDSLYTMKRAVERVSLVLEREPAGRAALRVEFANRRVGELEALIAKGGAVSAEDLLATYQDFLTSAEQDVEAAGLSDAQIRAFDKILDRLDAQIATLIQIRDVSPAPPAVKSRVDRAVSGAKVTKKKVESRRSIRRAPVRRGDRDDDDDGGRERDD